MNWRDTLADELYDKAAEMSFERRYQMMDEVGLIYGQKRQYAKDQAELRATIREIRRKYERKDANRLIRGTRDALDKQDSNLSAQLREYMDNETAAKQIKVPPIPSFKSVIEDQMREFSGLSEKRKAEARARLADQTLDETSLKDLENLGVGGMARESSIRLPKQIWQGRYLLMRIPDLMNPDNMENAYRPCIVWKAYAKIDENGDVGLAGLMMFPCTRSASGAFKYKMHVDPFGAKDNGDMTLSGNARQMFRKVDRRPSFLIADMPIIAPISTMYFQIDSDADFRQLPAHMVEKFARKVEIAQNEMGATQSVFGLQEIPKDWIEIELPKTPDHKMQKKLHGVEFVPSTMG